MTLRNTDSYCATLALPLKLSTPVAAFQLDVMPNAAVAANTSSAPWYFALMATVALCRLTLSMSDSARAVSMAVAASFSV